jgi:hypothetical protein
MAIRNKNVSFILCQNYERMNNWTIMSGCEVAPIRSFKLRQYHSGYVRFEAFLANVEIRIRDGRQENRSMILDRAKTIWFSTASETYLRHSQSRNQWEPQTFTTGLSDVTMRLSLTCVCMVQSPGGAIVWGAVLQAEMSRVRSRCGHWDI